MESIERAGVQLDRSAVSATTQFDERIDQAPGALASDGCRRNEFEGVADVVVGLAIDRDGLDPICECHHSSNESSNRSFDRRVRPIAKMCHRSPPSGSGTCRCGLQRGPDRHDRTTGSTQQFVAIAGVISTEPRHLSG